MINTLANKIEHLSDLKNQNAMSIYILCEQEVTAIMEMFD